MVDAMLVRPKMILNDIFGNYFSKFYLHQLYVAGRFIIGHFNKKETGYELGSQLIYEDISTTITEYQMGIRKGRLVVVKNLQLPEELVTSMVESGREYAPDRLMVCAKTIEQIISKD